MNRAVKALLSFAIFFVAVVAFTFTSTLVHELGHASAWGDAPAIEFHEDREAAGEAISHEVPRTIDGKNYRVMAVDKTTIALYPKNILIAGVTLGLAPAAMLDDPILGSTFYALDDEHYTELARGGDVTHWHHSAMPMIINGLIGIPIFIWLFKRPNALSMAAAWVNASEWRFNTHHAQEVGIPAGVYLAICVFMMLVVGVLCGYLAAKRIPQRALPQSEQNLASSLSK